MPRLIATSFMTSLILIALACTAGAVSPTAQPSRAPDALSIAADQLVFSTDTLAAPAGRPFQIAFENLEAPPHNVAIYRDSTATESLFVGEVIVGPRLVIYEVPPFEPGTYYFRCDLHPAMQGSLTAR